MSNLDSKLFNAIVDVLVPQMVHENARLAFMNAALAGCPVVTQIDYSGGANTFTRNLILHLHSFGRHNGQLTTVAVLEQLKLEVGSDKHPYINQLILQLAPPNITNLDASAQPTKDYIFISYARPEQPFAEVIEQTLQNAGYRVFRDTSDIRSGADWDGVIEKALRECDRMVLLLSTASMPERKEVKREWFYFDQRQKPIFPLYIEDCDLHSRLVSSNYIDCRTDFQGGLQKLLQELAITGDEPDASHSAPSVTAHNLSPIVKQLNKRNWLPEWTMIAGGEFLMGDASIDNAPEHMVNLQPYLMTKTPITQTQYQRFVRLNNHRLPIDDFFPDYSWDEATRNPPQGKDNHPVVLVSAEDADAYCKWLTDELQSILSELGDKWVVSLPSEAEWELAARGKKRYPYPWGQGLPAPHLANFDSTGTTPVGQYDHDRPYDVLDMIGNVWEWTCGAVDGKRILRGGSWQPGISMTALHGAYRYPANPNFIFETIGFRIVIRQVEAE